MEAQVLKPDPESERYTAERCHVIEMSNSPADEMLSIAHVRVEPGMTTALHRLEATAERYVVLAGQAQVEVGGRPPERVGPGHVVLIPPGLDQRITNTGDEDLVFLALCTPRFRPESYRDTEAKP